MQIGCRSNLFSKSDQEASFPPKQIFQMQLGMIQCHLICGQTLFTVVTIFVTVVSSFVVLALLRL